VTCGEKSKACKVFMGKCGGKRPLGRSRHRLKDNIKMYLKEIGWEDVDRINLAEDRDECWAVVHTVTNL
jgi:hypothetical protein